MYKQGQFVPHYIKTNKGKINYELFFYLQYCVMHANYILPIGQQTAKQTDDAE